MIGEYMHVSEIIDKLEDIVCNRMKNTDDAIVITTAINILSVLNSEGIAVVRTQDGVILAREPVAFMAGGRANGKSQYQAEMVKHYVKADEIKGICPCYHDYINFLHKRGVCWGTQELEPCVCGGDPSKCDLVKETGDDKC